MNVKNSIKSNPEPKPDLNINTNPTPAPKLTLSMMLLSPESLLIHKTAVVQIVFVSWPTMDYYWVSLLG